MIDFVTSSITELQYESKAKRILAKLEEIEINFLNKQLEPFNQTQNSNSIHINSEDSQHLSETNNNNTAGTGLGGALTLNLQLGIDRDGVRKPSFVTFTPESFDATPVNQHNILRFPLITGQRRDTNPVLSSFSPVNKRNSNHRALTFSDLDPGNSPESPNRRIIREPTNRIELSFSEINVNNNEHQLMMREIKEEINPQSNDKESSPDRPQARNEQKFIRPAIQVNKQLKLNTKRNTSMCFDRENKHAPSPSGTTLTERSTTFTNSPLFKSRPFFRENMKGGSEGGSPIKMNGLGIKRDILNLLTKIKYTISYFCYWFHYFKVAHSHIYEKTNDTVSNNMRRRSIEKRSSVDFGIGLQGNPKLSLFSGNTDAFTAFTKAIAEMNQEKHGMNSLEINSDTLRVLGKA